LDYYDQKLLIVRLLGADLFEREVYSSVPPHHDIHVFGYDGSIEMNQQSVDFVGQNLELPKALVGKDKDSF
jgi:hypothetical protein